MGKKTMNNSREKFQNTITIYIHYYYSIVFDDNWQLGYLNLVKYMNIS